MTQATDSQEIRGCLSVHIETSFVLPSSHNYVVSKADLDVGIESYL